MAKSTIKVSIKSVYRTPNHAKFNKVIGKTLKSKAPEPGTGGRAVQVAKALGKSGRNTGSTYIANYKKGLYNKGVSVTVGLGKGSITLVGANKATILSSYNKLVNKANRDLDFAVTGGYNKEKASAKKGVLQASIKVLQKKLGNLKGQVANKLLDSTYSAYLRKFHSSSSRDRHLDELI